MLEEFKEIGLTDGEAKVYYSLLVLGPSTVGPIVKRSKISNSNIYEVLDRLVDKGLVTYVLKEKTKHFQATNVYNLNTFLENEEKNLDRKKQILQKLIPNIKQVTKESAQDAEIFTGYKGIRAAYHVLLEEAAPGDEFLFTYIPQGGEVDKFYQTLNPLLKEAGVTLKGISTTKFRNNESIQKWMKIRFVDFPVPANIDICHDKVLIICWSGPQAFLIRSNELAASYKDYFEVLWMMAQP